MAIISLDNLKSFLGVTGSTEDAKLTFIVNAVNEFVKTYCHRTFDSTIYTDELYDGPGHAALTLRNYPIITISNVEVNGELINERSDVGEEGYYIMDAENGIIYNNNLWPRGRGNTKITYTAGYTAGSIPPDLYYACLSLAAYFRNTQGKAGILSESLGSYAYSIASGLNTMGGELTIPDVMVKNVLDRYRKDYHTIVF